MVAANSGRSGKNELSFLIQAREDKSGPFCLKQNGIVTIKAAHTCYEISTKSNRTNTSYLPRLCIQSHSAFPDKVQFCLTTRVTHERHKRVGISQAEQSCPPIGIQPSYQQLMCHGLISLVAFRQHTECHILIHSMEEKISH